MNSKQLGNITEVQVMLGFLQLGYNVLTPYGDCERYDFVADVNGKFVKIQVKSSKVSDDGTKFSFSTASTHYSDGKCVHHSYSKEDIDYFATVYNNQIYLIPVEECSSRLQSLRLISTKNGQTRGVKWAKDYRLEEVIKELC